MSESLASRFMGLFRGAERSHGTYAEEDEEAGGKRTIKRTARTLREPVTEELWALHLAGERPLGIVPICEDDTCTWGAVDIDVYTLDIPDLVKMLAEASVPAIVCRTKSGGAHVYLFFSEPIPAEAVVPKLRELAAFVGHGGSEIFPKQTTVLVKRGDLGSWLNMPYFGGDRSERYAVTPMGTGLSMERFLATAQASSLSRRGLADLRLQRTVEGFEAGPPCLESLTATGFPPHTRNNGMLAMGILAKKMHPDNWKQVLEKWSREYGGDPPFPNEELNSIIRSLSRKEYNYRCNDAPLNMRCNVGVCRSRPHGVGNGAGATVLEKIHVLKTEPPIFFVTLKTPAVSVEMNGADILNPKMFQDAVINQHREVIPEYKKQDWQNWVRVAMADSIEIEAPPDASVKGKFAEILEQFVTGRHRADSLEDLLSGKPWHDEENGTVHFRLTDVEEALHRAKFSADGRNGFTRSWITVRLKNLGGTSGQKKLKGQNTNIWCVKDSVFSWGTATATLPPRDDSPL